MSIPTTVADAAASLVASAQITATYQYSSIIDVTLFRRLTIFITVNHAAAAGELTLLPLIAATSAQPASGDDSWFAPAITDGTITAADLSASATLASGADYTKAPNWGRAVLRPGEIRLPAATNSTDTQRLAVTFDVTTARFFQLVYADIGAGTKLTLKIDYVAGN